MDINKIMLMWIPAAAPGHNTPGRAAYWCRAVADSRGFGIDDDSRGYYGQIACIKPGKYWSCKEAEVSELHTTRGGFFLVINTFEQCSLPDPPFLLTSDTALRLVADQDVTIEPAKEWAALEDDDGATERFFLCCPEWLGVLTVDKSVSKRRGRMLVFSNHPGARINPGQELAYASRPDEIFGTVHPYHPQ